MSSDADSVVSVERRALADDAQGAVWILRLRGSPREDGTGFENKLNPALLASLHAALDRVERETPAGAAGAVITVGEGRHYSDGLDIQHVLQLPRSLNAQGATSFTFLKDVERLLLRLLTFRLPTIACLNGHAYAGGLLLALAHDYRVMNSSKGFMCMTEVDLGAPLTPGFNALLLAKVPRPFAAKMMLEARRVSASEGVAQGFIEEAVPADKLMDAALALAARVAPKGASGAFKDIKEDLYLDAALVLRDAPPVHPKL